jgi:hypothetical protein
MQWLKTLTGDKSSSELEAEKTTEVAKLSASYDERISAAKQKESQGPSGKTDTGTTGGRRRNKNTRRAKKGKSRKASK